MVVNKFNENSNGIMNPLGFGLASLPGPFSTQYQLSDISYDYAIAGIPFIAGESMRNTYFRRQYTREFSQVRKDQFDAQQTPGEQSLLGWWLRSQNSFHGGAGTQYLDPSIDQLEPYRYSYSEGLDVMGTPGQVQLLQATKQIATGLTGPVFLAGVQKGGVDGVLVLDVGGKTLKFINAAGVATNYTMPGGLGFMANTFTVDGANYYFADVNNIWQGSIASPGTPAVTLWPASANRLTVVGWVKGRLMGAVNNSVYELVGTGAVPANTAGGQNKLPIPLFSHPEAGYFYTSIAETPGEILFAGQSGGYISQVHRFTIDNTGNLPVMSSGGVNTTMPVGEVINELHSYVSTYIGIGTNKGFRIGSIDGSGNLVYGPLIVQDPTGVGVNAIAGYDRFLFIGNSGNNLIPQQGWKNPTDATKVDMLMRIDLGNQTQSGSFAFANDLMTTGLDGTTVTAITNFGQSLASQGMLAFSTGSKVWLTDTTQKQANGFLYTGKIRLGTLEAKHFKYVSLRSQPISDGTMSINGQNSIGSVLTNIAVNITGTIDPNSPFFIGDVGNAQEWFQFKYSIARGTSNTNFSPVWNGYQLRALPGVNRQIQLTIPLIAHDHEMDKFGDLQGYDGFAYERFKALEAVVDSNNIVLFQDLNYGDSNLVVCDDYRFEQQAPELGKEASSTGGANNLDSNSHQGYIIIILRIVQ